MPEAESKKRANIQIAFGLTLLLTAEFFMFQRTEPFPSWFYPFAWWSYILMVDGLIYRLQGNSLIISRRRELLVMIPWSVTFWLIFEMLNIRMHNWHYVDVTDTLWLRWPGYFISYGTVLPGIFETTELLSCLGLYSKVSTKPRVISKFWFPIFFAGGMLFLLSPLLFPRYCFPFIWVGFVFFLEPLNYIHGSPSLLREWEEGNIRTPFLLLTAGLICGALWEFWNYWARTKWIYTVPFFDELKLFEMPLAGFLGFPPFAVECYVMYNFVSLFRFHRNWDKKNYSRNPDKRHSGNLMVIFAITMLLFYVLAFRSIDKYTVRSYSSLVPSRGLIEREKCLQRSLNSAKQKPEATTVSYVFAQILLHQNPP